MEFFQGRLIQTYQDANVRAGNVRYFFNAFSVHSGMSHYLEVNHKIYRWVRGVEPFYLEIPQRHSILFLTRKGQDLGVIHILDLRTFQEIRINGVEWFSGGHIGSKRAPGSDLSDYVERVEDNKIVLATRSGNRIIRGVLNLTDQKVDSVEDEKLPGKTVE
jgi:hypothetical protein